MTLKAGTNTIVLGNDMSWAPYIDKIELKCTSTGIDGVTIDDDSSDNTIYNLSGQKVNANYKGIIIQNGKKRWNK